MRYTILILILICISRFANGQIRDFQMLGSTPKDTLFILGTDTTAAGAKRGLGKWYNAYTLINNLAVGGGGGATNLSIGQSGGTQVIQSSSGTDVGVRNLYGLLITEGATDTLHFRVDTAYIATLYDITQIPINYLKAATATNTANHANYNQVWTWDALTSGTALKLTATGTTGLTGQKMLEVGLAGANASSTQSTTAASFYNNHTGTLAVNKGVEVTVTGPFSNTGINVAVSGNAADLGIVSTSDAGTGIYAASTSGLALRAEANPSSTTTVVNLADFRRLSSGTAAAGIGGNITFTTETATSSAVSNTISSKWTTATHASRVSDFIVSGVNAGTTADLLTIKGSGQTVLNKYGVGSFTSGTPVYNVLVDASGNLMEGSVPVGGTNIIQENDVNVQTANVTIDFQDPFDVTTTGATEVNILFDGGEFTTVTTAQSDDYLLMHDSGAATNEKMLWSDFIIDIVAFEDGNSSVGSGNTIDVGEGLDINMSPSTEANINIDASEFQIDGAADGTEYILIHDTDTTAGHQIQRRLVSGFGDTNFAEDDLTFTGNRSHDMGSSTLELHGDVCSVTFKDDNGGSGDNIIIANEVGAGPASTGGISFEGQNSGTPTDMFDVEGYKWDASQSTFRIIAEQATDAEITYEKNANLSNNTTESHLTINGGISFTQDYEWTGTGADLTLDRGYYNVVVSGAGAIGDEINLPEVIASSTDDNWNSSLTSAQVMRGQEYVITTLRNASTGLVLRPFTGDLINGQTSITLPYNANGTSVILKCVRFSGGVGYWFTY